MQNPPSIISTPPPLPPPPPFPLSPPPQSTGQIVVLPAPPPPPFRTFAGAPSSDSQITVLPALPPPPQFSGGSSSFDLSPLEFLLALIAIVTIPALIYTYIFAYGCSSSSSSTSRRRRSSTNDLSGEISLPSEHSRHDVETVPTGEVYKKDTHAAKIGGECPVCLSVFADGEEVRQLSVCKHSFHTSCIDLWLNDHNNCPICRTTVTPASTDATVKSSGSSRDSDLQQGLPDASSLV